MLEGREWGGIKNILGDFYKYYSVRKFLYFFLVEIILLINFYLLINIVLIWD